MRKIFKNYYFFAFLTGILFAFNPAASTAQFVKNTSFEVNFKGVGTAFYTIDNKTGQLSYMLDVGQQSGVWLSYGEPYRANGVSDLHFKAIERGDSTGTSFYILNSKTGQLNYMLDFGLEAGNWASYGEPLEKVTISEFEAQVTPTGMVFYAYDGMKKQMHFMQDFGEQAGTWQAYGRSEY